MQYTAYDCVNSSAESVEISQCSSGKVSVTKQGSEKLNGKFSDNTVFMLIVGVICGLAVGVLCFMLYLSVIKRKNKAKEEKDRH